MENNMPKETSAMIIDIFIIQIILAEEKRLADRNWLKKLSAKMVKLSNLKVVKDSYVECPANGHEMGYSYKGVQFFIGGFLELGVVAKERSLFFNFSSLGELKFELLEKAANSIMNGLSGAKKITRLVSTRFPKISQ
jgi:hypothetical protein